jgi:hypothetical protein
VGSSYELFYDDPDTGEDPVQITDNAGLNVTPGITDHGNLDAGSLLDDDHTQYALLAGRLGGQTFYGGTTSGNLTLQCAADPNVGIVDLIGTATSIKDQTGNTIGRFPFVGGPIFGNSSRSYSSSELEVQTFVNAGRYITIMNRDQGGDAQTGIRWANDQATSSPRFAQVEIFSKSHSTSPNLCRWYSYTDGLDIQVFGSDPIRLGVNNDPTQVVIDDDDNVGFNTTDYGSGEGVVALKDSPTAPSVNPSGGGVMYSSGGALYWRSSGGVVSKIAG